MSNREWATDDDHTTHVNPHGKPWPEPRNDGPHRANLWATAGFFAAVGLFFALVVAVMK